MSAAGSSLCAAPLRGRTTIQVSTGQLAPLRRGSPRSSSALCDAVIFALDAAAARSRPALRGLSPERIEVEVLGTLYDSILRLQTARAQHNVQIPPELEQEIAAFWRQPAVGMRPGGEQAVRTLARRILEYVPPDLRPSLPTSARRGGYGLRRSRQDGAARAGVRSGLRTGRGRSSPSGARRRDRGGCDHDAYTVDLKRPIRRPRPVFFAIAPSVSRPGSFDAPVTERRHQCQPRSGPDTVVANPRSVSPR